MHWLHFVGKKYYTETSFVREAKQFGVTRRVSIRQLKNMNYGDTVLLAINDQKSSLLFGKFVISMLSGMSGEQAELMQKAYEMRKVSDGGAIVSRGCGSYMTAACYAISGHKSLGEVAETMDKASDQGKLMIGGDFISTDRIRLKSMRLNQGFRPFDLDSFLAAVIAAKAVSDADPPAVKGHFYWATDRESVVVPLDEHRAEVVTDYRRQ